MSNVLIGFVLIVFVAALIFIGKKYGFKKLLNGTPPMRQGSRILWREIGKEEINESIITEIAGSGGYLRLDDKKTWTEKKTIQILEVLTIPEVKKVIPAQVKQTTKKAKV